jgi:hypothetical protein
MKVLDTPESSPATFASEEPCVAVCGALYVRGLYTADHFSTCGSRVALEASDLQAKLINLSFSLNIGWVCTVCGVFNSVALLHRAYELSLEQMIFDVAHSRIPGSVIPCTEVTLRALLKQWRTSEQYIAGPSAQRDGTFWETQRISRRAIAHGLDPAMVHDLMRHYPSHSVEDVITTLEALERANQNKLPS